MATLLQADAGELQALLQAEPRLLMPASKALADNHAAITAALGISSSTLNAWARAAPMLLLVPAPQLQQRLAALRRVIGLLQEGDLGLGVQYSSTADTDGSSSSSSSSLDMAAAGSGEQQQGAADGAQQQQQPQQAWVSVLHDAKQLLAYVSRDPRVLLLAPGELHARLRVLQPLLCCRRRLLAWLVCAHPSYLVCEPGSLSGWVSDVRQLAGLSGRQAAALAACPQV